MIPDDIKKDHRKTVVLSIRITEDDKEFLEKNDIHVSRLFRKAIEELRNRNI